MRFSAMPCSPRPRLPPPHPCAPAQYHIYDDGDNYAFKLLHMPKSSTSSDDDMEDAAAAAEDCLVAQHLPALRSTPDDLCSEVIRNPPESPGGALGAGAGATCTARSGAEAVNGARLGGKCVLCLGEFRGDGQCKANGRKVRGPPPGQAVRQAAEAQGNRRRLGANRRRLCGITGGG